MSVTAKRRRVVAGEENRSISAMAFVAISLAQARISATFSGHARQGERPEAGRPALAIGEWPRDLDLLIVDLGGAAIRWPTPRL